MLSQTQRTAALVLAGLFALSAFNACAQWTPGKTVVYLDELSLAGAAGSSAPKPMGGALVNDELMNASSTDNTTMNNTSLNKTATNNSLLDDSLINSAASAQPIDLSRYSQDRRSHNLAGYRNIMYPFAESRGTTASTAGSGGCGCG